MSSLPQPPKSPTLLPPRKSVELEDPGAHELSDNEEDEHFSDAQEDREPSGPQSPIPVTRVEKVDDRESHGEVPGTDAYKIRTQDAVPDEIEVIPEGSHRRSASGGPIDRPVSPGGTPIPQTVVEKVDPMSPSHGDVPGTLAYSKRKADAVPDVIKNVEDHAPINSEDQGVNISAEIPIPTTVITKVDSLPSHGEVPGTKAFDMRKGDTKPDIVEKAKNPSGGPNRSRPKQTRSRSVVSMASPIAADGGFGQMESDESEDSEAAEEPEEAGDKDAKSDTMEPEQEIVVDVEDGLGDDFDDFEAGAQDEDFGDFDDGEESEQIEPEVPSIHSLPALESPFVSSINLRFSVSLISSRSLMLFTANQLSFDQPLLDLNTLDDLDDIIAATNIYADVMFPSTKGEYLPPSSSPSNQDSIFLTDRSLSLWSQLVAPPPLQPPNWVRSRIRRLFLVSLGVPVDLDEILPASKQKKLILPSTHLRSGSQSPPKGGRAGSRVRLKQDNDSTTSVDKPSTSKGNRRRKGPSMAPEIDLQTTKLLCATTAAALDNMTEDELQGHVTKLEELTTKASQVLEYWLKRRESALGDKEAFEGVIENLVKHARRVRR